jgi:hypothetical protein
VHFLHDRQTDSAPLLAVSAAATWTQSLAARAHGTSSGQAAGSGRGQLAPAATTLPAPESSWRSSDRRQPAADTGWPERRTARPASGTGWPAVDPAPPESDRRRPALRPEAYRHLWQPIGRKPPPRQALGRPYVWDGGQDGQNGGPDTSHGQDSAAALTAGLRAQGRPDSALTHASADGADALTGAAVSTERAVIGDEIRQLAVWCEIGACISRHTDPAAIGETDIRSRAVASGWCVDAFGRLICQSCQQFYPVWSARPPAPRSRAGWQHGAASIQVGQHRRTYK